MVFDLYRFEIGRESVLFFKQTDSPLILNWMPLNSIYIGVELANFYNIVLKYQNPSRQIELGRSNVFPWEIAPCTSKRYENLMLFPTPYI